jgi:tetratricopeptide (TPR) repeat protein
MDVKKLLLYASSALSFVLLINQSIQAWSGNNTKLSLALLGLFYLLSLGSTAVVAFKKESRTFAESDPIQVYSYPRFYKLARVGLIALLIIPLPMLTVFYKYSRQECNQIRILVANFYGESPAKYQITEEVISKLKDALHGYSDTQIITSNNPITEQEGSVEARKQGEKECAKLVLWGRYIIVDKDIKLIVHMESLDKSLIALGQSVTYSSLSKLDGFQFQITYPSEIRSLALCVVGVSRFQAHKFEEALEILKTALNDIEWPKDLDSLRGNMLFYRGNTYSILGDCTSAIKDFTACIGIDPSFSLAYNNRGMIAPDAIDGIRDCEKAKELDPTLIYPYVNLGKFYFQTGKLSEASENLSKAIEINPSFILARLNRGSVRLAEKKYTLAIEDYSFAIKNYDNTSIVSLPPSRILELLYIGRGQAYVESGSIKEAFADLDQSLQINPSCGECYDVYAQAYRQSKNYEKAKEYFFKSLELNPKDAATHFNLGQLYIDLGETDSALRENLLAIQCDQKFSEAYAKAGFLYVRKGDFSKAVEFASTGIAINPYNANAYYSLGLAHYQLKQYQESLDDFSKAIILSPIKYSYFYSKRGRTLNMLKMFSEVIKDCEQAIALDPNNAEAFLMRGLAYANLSDKNRARTDLNRVLDLTTDSELVMGVVVGFMVLGEKPGSHIFSR